MKIIDSHFHAHDYFGQYTVEQARRVIEEYNRKKKELGIEKGIVVLLPEHYSKLKETDIFKRTSLYPCPYIWSVSQIPQDAKVIKIHDWTLLDSLKEFDGIIQIHTEHLNLEYIVDYSVNYGFRMHLVHGVFSLYEAEKRDEIARKFKNNENVVLGTSSPQRTYSVDKYGEAIQFAVKMGFEDRIVFESDLSPFLITMKVVVGMEDWVRNLIDDMEIEDENLKEKILYHNAEHFYRDCFKML